MHTWVVPWSNNMWEIRLIITNIMKAGLLGGPVHWAGPGVCGATTATDDMCVWAISQYVYMHSLIRLKP